jgi:hypothetical protein
MKNVISLSTPKGEEVLVNFKNVAYCAETNNKHTSLRINYSQGKDNLGFYLIVVENIEQIHQKLHFKPPI